MNIKVLTLLILSSISFMASAEDCKNLVQKPYNQSPNIFGPKESLGKGIQIWMGGKLVSIPDTRAKCLPISLRYNNLGAMKTKSTGYWPGQINKDSKGHAVFSNMEDGVAALGQWLKTKHDSGKKYSAYDIMSIYAPPDHCVGDIGTAPNNCTYGLNPTKEYATRVARSVHKKYNEPLNLNGADCKDGRDGMYALMTEIATFEAGGNFCGRKDKNTPASCVIDPEVFGRVMNKVFGSVNYGSCTDPVSAHEKDHNNNQI